MRSKQSFTFILLETRIKRQSSQQINIMQLFSELLVIICVLARNSKYNESKLSRELSLLEHFHAQIYNFSCRAAIWHQKVLRTRRLWCMLPATRRKRRILRAMLFRLTKSWYLVELLFNLGLVLDCHTDDSHLWNRLYLRWNSLS